VSLAVAILTLTRDRLPYSQHCFQTLRDNAGCDFDWFVLDQNSSDGTVEWLLDQDDLTVMTLGQNVGICRGLNLLLTEALNTADYDVIVRFDNDCEVTQPGTLAAVCEAAVDYEAIVAPRVEGLRNPPPTVLSVSIGDQAIDVTNILGGIFMAVPSQLFWRDGYEYDETNPPWSGDEAIVPWYRQRGGLCGYLQGYAVNHYLTSDGQDANDVPYLERKLAEMSA
jgi:hypothetical protein